MTPKLITELQRRAGISTPKTLIIDGSSSMRRLRELSNIHVDEGLADDFMTGYRAAKEREKAGDKLGFKSAAKTGWNAVKARQEHDKAEREKKPEEPKEPVVRIPSSASKKEVEPHTKGYGKPVEPKPKRELHPIEKELGEYPRKGSETEKEAWKSKYRDYLKKPSSAPEKKSEPKHEEPSFLDKAIDTAKQHAQKTALKHIGKGAEDLTNWAAEKVRSAVKNPYEEPSSHVPSREEEPNPQHLTPADFVPKEEPKKDIEPEAPEDVDEPEAPEDVDEPEAHHEEEPSDFEEPIKTGKEKMEPEAPPKSSERDYPERDENGNLTQYGKDVINAKAWEKHKEEERQKKQQKKQPKDSSPEDLADAERQQKDIEDREERRKRGLTELREWYRRKHGK